MKVFFGHLAGIAADPGYFYLCPECYGTLIEPELPQVIERLRPPETPAKRGGAVAEAEGVGEGEPEAAQGEAQTDEAAQREAERRDDGEAKT